MKTILCALLLMLSFACKKNGNETEPALCESALVQYSDPLTDGFGWTLKLPDGKTLVPDNISEAFKQDSLSVNVCYTITGEKARCRCFNPPPVVHITNISLR